MAVVCLYFGLLVLCLQFDSHECFEAGGKLERKIIISNGRQSRKFFQIEKKKKKKEKEKEKSSFAFIFILFSSTLDLSTTQIATLREDMKGGQ